jgi:hypothetical protein
MSIDLRTYIRLWLTLTFLILAVSIDNANAIKLALSQSSFLGAALDEATDDFERSELGDAWDADPEFQIQQGNLVNTAVTGDNRWEYMATFEGLPNPTTVAMRWSISADSVGINDGGLALLLNAPTKDASGYLAWITTNDNVLRLWTITDGKADQDLNLEMNSLAPVPGSGDEFRVSFEEVGVNLEFEYFVNAQLAGVITLPNPNVGGEWYSGVILRHDRNNDVAEFFAKSGGDSEPPAQIQNLAAAQATATSVTLTWTASGDDGNSGLADAYDLRFSTSQIADEISFQNADPVFGLPAPLPAGFSESFIFFDLLPGTTYFFALKVLDRSGNASPISNVATITTSPGTLITDDFNRSTLGSNWLASPSIQVVDNELANASADQSTWGLAIFRGGASPTEVSFRWSTSSDTVGIDQIGMAVMLDAPRLHANGYLITRRTLQNQIRLWRIVSGQNPSSPIIETPLLAKPKPGQEFKIVISSDQDGNHFKIFVNGQEDVTITDPSLFVNPANVVETFAGAMFAGGRNNRIDNFKMLNAQQPVSVFEDPPVSPVEFVLSQNYPNPFNAQTRINYTVPFAGLVTIEVFNLLGQSIKTLFDGQQSAGRFSVQWDGTTNSGNLVGASGFYLVRMSAGSFVAVRKITLLK